MTSSLLNIVNNLSERIDKIKFKYERNDKKCETWDVITVTIFLDTQALKLT